MQRFRPHPDGVELRLAQGEAEALEVLGELLASVGDPEHDPAAARLTVPAYEDDAEAAGEFQRLMGPELAAGRAADRSAVAMTLEAAVTEPVVLSMGEAEAWLLVLNEARLVLAARLGIEEEGWGEESDDPVDLDPGMVLLHYLTYLHAELTGVLMGRL